MTIKKILLTLAALVVVVVAALGIALATFDLDAQRPKLAELLSAKTGHVVKLDGPISLHISREGIGFTIRDVHIGNPSWASRPELATIGRFELGVALGPLLRREVEITALTLDHADILKARTGRTR